MLVYFLRRVLPLKSSYREKGTLILTSLLQDLGSVCDRHDGSRLSMARAFTLGRAPCALSGLGHLVSPEVPRRAPAGPVAAVATCLHVRQRMGRGGGKGKGSGKGKGQATVSLKREANGGLRWGKDMPCACGPQIEVTEKFPASKYDSYYDWSICFARSCRVGSCQ